MNTPNLVYVEKNCIVCTSSNHSKIYESIQPAGAYLGTLTVSLHSCHVCGFVWQNPQLSDEVLANYYASDINASGAVFHSHNIHSEHSRKQQSRVKFFRPILSTTKTAGSIIEIGCSTGEFLTTLNLPNWSAWGIEPSASASKIAKANGVQLMKGWVTSCNLGRLKWDALAAFSVFEHLGNLPEILQKTSECLKPDGKLLFEVPNSENPEPQLSDFFTYEHLWHFTRDSFSKLLGRYGFCNLVFDEDVQDSRLRGFAMKNRMSSPVGSQAEGKRLEITIQEYALRRAKLISSTKYNISDFLRSGKRGIYGAGIHTLHLLQHYPALKNVICIVDSNSDKWGTFLSGIPVVNLDSAIKLGVRAILISSFKFEREIFELISKYESRYKLEAFRLYGE